ncbi:hypothetical protein [Frankia sp. Cppng1_Ct_nod]|uniref:hypothetical protein n=1 Tax=Frankia sp. Cppng1_Ct_nod TaxID=2897162 RepID=UPI001A95234A|nr:hypothetical protein [Frankia sp. Cppng1_Ct_nod]
MADATLMWEARAAAGRLDDLVAWVGRAVTGRVAEIYRGVGDGRDVVVVLVHVPVADGSATRPAGDTVRSVLDRVPPGLVARPPQAWDFERVSEGGSNADDQERAG